VSTFRGWSQPVRVIARSEATKAIQEPRALELTVTEAAKRLRVTRQQLHRILAEDSGISPEMALRLGKFCGNGPHLWIRMQEAYDLWQAEKRIARDIERIETASAQKTA
jgi:addiction module HigA family antidote